MKKSSKDRLRPLVATLRNAEFVQQLRDKHKDCFRRPSRHKDLEQISPQLVGLIKENSSEVQSVEYVNQCVLLGWFGSAADHVIGKLPKPACRSKQDLEAALRGYMFCDRDFQKAYSLFFDAVLSQEYWPRQMEGRMFTPSSFVRLSENRQCLEKIVAHLKDTATESALNERTSPGLKTVCHHPFEEIEIGLDFRTVVDGRAIVATVASDSFSRSAAQDCLGEFCGFASVLVRSFELMDGNPDCFGENIISISPLANTICSIMDIVVDSVWFCSVPKKSSNLYRRIQNAFRYLSAADMSTDFRVRMILSVAALESILSGKEEIAKTVAQRSAAILSSVAGDREGTFKSVKKLYDFRSRYLHGDDPRVGSDYLSRVCRSLAGSVLIRSLAWIEFGNRVGRDSSSDKDFFSELDDAYRVCVSVTGLDTEDNQDWCPLLAGFRESLG